MPWSNFTSRLFLLGAVSQRVRSEVSALQTRMDQWVQPTYIRRRVSSRLKIDLHTPPPGLPMGLGIALEQATDTRGCSDGGEPFGRAISVWCKVEDFDQDHVHLTETLESPPPPPSSMDAETR